jgi:hypothetical protein
MPPLLIGPGLKGSPPQISMQVKLLINGKTKRGRLIFPAFVLMAPILVCRVRRDRDQLENDTPFVSFGPVIVRSSFAQGETAQVSPLVVPS